MYKWNNIQVDPRSQVVGSVFSSVYFPTVDTLSLMGLQVTPEVRARGPAVRLRSRFQFPSSCYISGNSPKTATENASAALRGVNMTHLS